MNNKQKEFSLRRSINNTLRKTNQLNNGIDISKKAPLKKFVPNIHVAKENEEGTEDNRRNQNNGEFTVNGDNNREANIKNEQISNIVEKTIQFKEEKEQRRKERFEHKFKKETMSMELRSAMNEHVNIFKENMKEPKNELSNTENDEHFQENEEGSYVKRKENMSTDISDMNNISKNIFYNKVHTEPDAHFIPLTLPFFKENEEQNRINKMFSQRNRFFFGIQLPNMLPSMITGETQKKVCNNSIDKIKTTLTKMEMSLDNKEQKMKKIGSSKEDPYKLTNINTLPNGKFAKLIIYKNKKVKMKIGDIMFDVNEGSTCSFAQDVGCYIKENSEFIFLGNCDKKLIVTPNVEHIINTNFK